MKVYLNKEKITLSEKANKLLAALFKKDEKDKGVDELHRDLNRQGKRKLCINLTSEDINKLAVTTGGKVYKDNAPNENTIQLTEDAEQGGIYWINICKEEDIPFNNRFNKHNTTSYKRESFKALLSEQFPIISQYYLQGDYSLLYAILYSICSSHDLEYVTLFPEQHHCVSNDSNDEIGRSIYFKERKKCIEKFLYVKNDQQYDKLQAESSFDLEKNELRIKVTDSCLPTIKAILTGSEPFPSSVEIETMFMGQAISSKLKENFQDIFVEGTQNKAITKDLKNTFVGRFKNFVDERMGVSDNQNSSLDQLQRLKDLYKFFELAKYDDFNRIHDHALSNFFKVIRTERHYGRLTYGNTYSWQKCVQILQEKASKLLKDDGDKYLDNILKFKPGRDWNISDKLRWRTNIFKQGTGNLSQRRSNTNIDKIVC